MSWRRVRGLSVLSIFLKSAFTSLCCFLSRSVAFIAKHLRGWLEQDRCLCPREIGSCRGGTASEPRAPGGGGSRSGWRQGQMCALLESATTPSPLAQIRNVPPAVFEYLYEAPEPTHPWGSGGRPFMNGPPVWFCMFTCCVKSTLGRSPPAWAADVVGQVVVTADRSGRPPQCAVKRLTAEARARVSACALAIRARLC